MVPDIPLQMGFVETTDCSCERIKDINGSPHYQRKMESHSRLHDALRLPSNSTFYSCKAFGKIGFRNRKGLVVVISRKRTKTPHGPGPIAL